MVGIEKVDDRVKFPPEIYAALKERSEQLLIPKVRAAIGPPAQHGERSENRLGENQTKCSDDKGGRVGEIEGEDVKNMLADIVHFSREDHEREKSYWSLRIKVSPRAYLAERQADILLKVCHNHGLSWKQIANLIMKSLSLVISA
jgi:hypothetical protein